MPEPSTPANHPQPSRTEVRNERVRRQLQPLAQGERPPAIKLAALVALTIAAINLLAYTFGVTIDGHRPALLTVLLPSTIMVMLGYGMLKMRYWATLIFQGLLALLLVFLALMLTLASNWLAVVVVLSIILPAGALFWKLVRVLARMQAPSRSALDALDS